MLLGDLIASFQDEASAGEALLALDDLALAARVVSAAEQANMTPGAFAARAIDAFVSAASDEEWLTLLGLMSRAADPGHVFLRRALATATKDCHGNQVAAGALSPRSSASAG